jgi:hypothetical protein
MIGGLEQRINTREQGRKQRAETWIVQAEAYINEIDKYRHDLFKPNKLQTLRQDIQTARNNINNGDPEAAMGIAQVACNRAIELRLDVIEAELVWERYYETLLVQVTGLAADINSAKIREWQIGGERIQARVDYWTNGQLSELESRLAEIWQIVQNPNDRTSDELVSLTTEVINLSDRLSDEKSGILTHAKERLMLSAYRADMANVIASAMKKEGWEISEYGYKDGEQNDELHLKISDVNGNDIVFIVSPRHDETNKAPGNKLEQHFFNDTEFDTNNATIAGVYVQQALKDNGIDAELSCVGDFENRPSNRKEIRDVRNTVSQ